MSIKLSRQMIQQLILTKIFTGFIIRTNRYPFTICQMFIKPNSLWFTTLLFLTFLNIQHYFLLNITWLMTIWNINLFFRKHVWFYNVFFTLFFFIPFVDLIFLLKCAILSLFFLFAVCSLILLFYLLFIIFLIYW